MVKRLRFQENRRVRHRRDRTSRGPWVFESTDMVIAAAGLAALLWVSLVFAA